jgi:hypothetical protein
MSYKLVLSLILFSIILLFLNTPFNANAQQSTFNNTRPPPYPYFGECNRCVIQIPNGNSINTGENSINVSGKATPGNSINTGENSINVSGKATPGNSINTGQASARINSVYTEDNKTMEYQGAMQLGLIIHVSFTVQGMQGKNGIIAAYFFFNNGSQISQGSPPHSLGGQAATYQGFSPGNISTSYNDTQLLMPYITLTYDPTKILSPIILSGTVMRYDIVIWDNSNRTILAVSPGHYFRYE